LVADAVARDGNGDARLLCALGSRFNSHLAGGSAKNFCLANHYRGALDRADGRPAGVAHHQRLAVRGGPQWLGTYAVVASFGFAASVAIALRLASSKALGRSGRLMARYWRQWSAQPYDQVAGGRYPLVWDILAP
jgi:hypothetical protein